MMISYFKSKNCCYASNAWKSILDRRDVLMRGLAWILDNRKSNNFWHDIWMKDFPLINKIKPDKTKFSNQEAKVSDFIDETKH